jgi:CBS domain containing-hemolysin-like protein
MEGLLEPEAREMIEGVIELGDDEVSDVMMPRSKVDAMDVDLSWPQVLDFVIGAGRTRVPVYEKQFDKIIGVLYVKDLLPELAKDPAEPRKPIRELLREPWTIPATIPLDDLLREFLKKRKHLAVVADEYGAIQGVVTIEDVLEEIVGEIFDEFDEEASQEDDREIVQRDLFSAEVVASVHVDAVNEHLGLNLPESDEWDTIGGFVVSQLKRIPAKGDSLDFNGVRITVIDSSPRTVERVLVETQRGESEKPA